MLRVFLDESAEALGVARGNLTLDFAEFYDSLGPTLALESALAFGFPATSVGLSLVIYVASRCIKASERSRDRRGRRLRLDWRRRR